MARPRRGPDDTTLRRWFVEGLTAKEMAERWAEEAGEDRRVSSKAIASQLSRAGLLRRPRYEEALPWSVREAHTRSHYARVLRAMARKRRGEELPEAEEKILAGFERKREEQDFVIGYLRSSEEGFVAVDRASVPKALLDEEFPIIKVDLGEL